MVRPEPRPTTGSATRRSASGRLLVEATPKSPEHELHGKTVAAIDPADRSMRRSSSTWGALLKVWTLEKVEKIDGMWTPLVQRTGLGSHESCLTSPREYNADLPTEAFNRSYLTR
jgi:hypothetical protein